MKIPNLIDKVFGIFYDGSEGHPANFLRHHTIVLHKNEKLAKEDCERTAYKPKAVYIYDAPIDEIEIAAKRYEKVRKLNVSQYANIYKLNISSSMKFDQIIDELNPDLSNFTEVVTMKLNNG